MAIGLLGGSFNPAHEAHRLISLTALKRLGLSRVWWLVSPGNPLKSHSDLAPLDERVRRARRMADHPLIEVTAYEAALGTSYTAETLRVLKTRRPGVRFVWLMGGDNLAGFHRWRDWRRIFELMPIAVADRPSWRFRAIASPAATRFAGLRLPESEARRLPLAQPPAWMYLSGPLSPVSSTLLRAEASAKENGKPLP
jgi:nicotinate-nucleotide adenylyltransferase